jgi:hypothetical protein
MSRSYTSPPPNASMTCSGTAYLTSKKSRHVSIIRIIYSILFRKTIAVYSEDHNKPVNALCGQNVELLSVKAGGIHNYHGALKG